MRRYIKVIDKYGLTEMLGEGMYGKVYKGVNTENNEDVAVKVIQSDKFVRNPQLEEYTVNEIKVLTQLGDTPHIVRYLDMLKTANNYYFVYEYCNGGTLEKQIKHYKNAPQQVIPLSKTIIYFGEILSAFKLLTKNKIMHRDLKPANILLHNGRIKIADFGFSKSLISPTDLAQTMLGSPIYMAPQVLTGQPYTIKADIWSLGVVLYEMVFGNCPFQSKQIAKLIQMLQVEEVKYPRPIPSILQNILRRMLVKDASKRIDWVELFQYKITQSGELIQPSKTLKTVTSGIVSSGFSSTLKPFGSGTLGVNQIQQNRRSPMPNDRDKTYNLTRNQYKHSSTGLSKDHQGQLKQLASNHQKSVLAVQLSIDVLKRPPKQSFGLAFIINKIVYKQLNTILQFLNKDWLGDSPHSDKNQQNMVNRFKQVIIDQLIDLDSSLKTFKDVLQSLQGDINMIQFRKNRYLKNFYNSYRSQLLQDHESIILISQMMDFFEQTIVLKKQSYKRVDKHQLLKQVESRINKLI